MVVLPGVSHGLVARDSSVGWMTTALPAIPR